MSSPITLGLSGLDAVTQRFLGLLTRPLDTRFIEFTLNAPESQLIVTSRAEASDGTVGIYKGSFTFTYVKDNLNTLLPYALSVQADYPFTYRKLRSLLQTRYQFQVEPLEFAKTLGGVGLTDDDLIDVPLTSNYVELKLYATADSGRFTTGSFLSLIVLQPLSRIPLKGLLDVDSTHCLDCLATS